MHRFTHNFGYDKDYNKNHILKNYFILIDNEVLSNCNLDIEKIYNRYCITLYKNNLLIGGLVKNLTDAKKYIKDNYNFVKTGKLNGNENNYLINKIN